MTGGQLHWLWWAGGVVVTLLGVVLLLWALFGDRSRGRRRCPKCWYDLSATEGMRCSECGYEARSEEKFFKTRRQWKWVRVSVLLIVITTVLLGWRTIKTGWVKVAPTTLLIQLIPVDADVAGLRADIEQQVWDELNARLGGFDFAVGYSAGAKDELWAWQLSLLQRNAQRILQVDGPWQRYDEAISLLTIESESADESVSALFAYYSRVGGNGWRALSAIGTIAAQSRVSADTAETIIDQLLLQLAEAPEQDSLILMITIGAFGDVADQAVPDIVRILQSGTQQQQMFAMFALGDIGEPASSALPLLIERAGSDDVQIAGNALQTLGRLRSQRDEVRPVLLSALESESIDRRFAAARALGALGDERDIPHLIDALQDEEAMVRWMAANALGGFGDQARGALPTLKDCLNDPDPRVRRSSADAITRIEGDSSE